MKYLALAEVLAIHQTQLALFGGMNGVRDQGGLESALAQPLAGFGDRLMHPDITSAAAAYLFHICMDHPFADGNKRTALASCGVFLHLNGCRLTYVPSERRN